MNSEFLAWFVAQHGERNTLYNDDDAALQSKVNAGHHANLELERRHMWDAQQTAALYAWNAARGESK